MKYSSLQLLPLVAFVESGGNSIRRAYQIQSEKNNKDKGHAVYTRDPEEETDVPMIDILGEGISQEVSLSTPLTPLVTSRDNDQEAERLNQTPVVDPSETPKLHGEHSFATRQQQYPDSGVSDDSDGELPESQESVVQTVPEALSGDDASSRVTAPEVIPEPEYDATRLIQESEKLIRRIDRVFDDKKVLPDLSKETDYKNVAALWEKDEKIILGHMSYDMDTKEDVESRLTSMRTFIKSAEEAIDNPGSRLSDSVIGDMLNGAPSLLLAEVDRIKFHLLQNKGNFLENLADAGKLKTSSDISSKKIEKLNQKIKKAGDKSTEQMIKELAEEKNLRGKYELAREQHVVRMDAAFQVLLIHVKHEQQRIQARLSFAESEKTQHDEIKSKLHDLLDKVKHTQTKVLRKSTETPEEYAETKMKQEILRKVLVDIVDYLNITEPSFDAQQLHQNVESVRKDADLLISSLAKIGENLKATPKDTYIIPEKKVLKNPGKALEFLEANTADLVSSARHPHENKDTVASRMAVLHIAAKLAEIRLRNDGSNEWKKGKNEVEKELVEAQKVLTKNVSGTKEDIDTWNLYIIQTSKWFRNQSNQVTAEYNSLNKIKELKKKLSHYKKLQDSIVVFNYENQQAGKSIIGFEESDEEAMKFSLENPYINRLEKDAQDKLEVIIKDLETQKNEMEKPELSKKEKESAKKLYESKMTVVQEMVTQLVGAHRA